MAAQPNQAGGDKAQPAGGRIEGQKSQQDQGANKANDQGAKPQK